jgi:hypothetical protein
MAASAPLSATATAAGPDSSPVLTGTPGAISLDRLTAVSMARSDIPRNAMATVSVAA